MPVNTNLRSALNSRAQRGLKKPAADASPEELKDLLATQKAKITDGNGISKREAVWLLDIAEHPNADASVFRSLKTQYGDVNVSIRDAGLKNKVGAFLKNVDGFNDGVPAGGNVLDIRTGRIDEPVADPVSEKKIVNVIRHRGPIEFAGPHRVKSDSLMNTYRSAREDEFGTTRITGLPSVEDANVNEQGRLVKDMIYDLGDGKVGMHIIPVTDSGDSKEMDAHLREKMGIGNDDPIYSFMSFVHPEMHTGDIKQMGSTYLKTEMGCTHLGAYKGSGESSHSPGGYHNNSWGVQGYPANITMMSLDGVDQATLNKNSHLADAILNENVEFPPDYKNDKYRTVDLNTSLMFYRDWIKGEPYLREDSTWHTYCSEHKTMVANVAVNLPHNEASFEEVFGAEGKQLWTEFKAAHKKATGNDFTTADETHFEPLWKQEGLTTDQIKPFADLAAYTAYDDSRHAGTLDSFAGFKPLKPGQGLVWAPETTADLLNDFVATYTSFRDVGGPAASAVLLGFHDTVADRTGVQKGDFMAMCAPFVSNLMVADAKMNATDESWAMKATGGLYVALGGKQEDFSAEGTINAQLMDQVKMFMAAAMGELPGILAGADRAQPFTERADAAYAWLIEAMQPDLERARETAVTDPWRTQFYSPPAVINRVAIGLHESNPRVHFKTIATAMDATEVDKIGQ